MAGNGQFFSQVIRWGVEVICSGVGLGLDFDVAVYIFRVPPWPPIILVMTCYFLVLGWGSGQFFLSLVLHAQL